MRAKRFKSILAALLVYGVMAQPASEAARRSASPLPAPLPWDLVWADNFTGPHVDAKKWNIAGPAEVNYDGGVNSYDVRNVYIEDHQLVIRSQPLSAPNARGETAYSSGRVTTKQKFGFLYGKVEIRAKLPGTQGLWPALWMLPHDKSWPPELDIMELLGDNPSRVYLTAHWGTRQRDEHDQTAFSGPDFTQDYHVFGIEWDPKQVIWVVDGVQQKVMTHDVPNRAMYLILNTSVGGDWPGMPDGTTVFPAFMRVDYVKVYQHPRHR